MVKQFIKLAAEHESVIIGTSNIALIEGNKDGSTTIWLNYTFGEGVNRFVIVKENFSEIEGLLGLG